jgi:hypothetical protein
MGDRMTEAQLQSAIIDLAHALGYRAAHFRPALTSKGWRTPVSADGKGFPDLNLVKKDRVVYIECKSEKGKQSPEQREWEIAIRESGAEYFLFRPSDWMNDNVEKALGS